MGRHMGNIIEEFGQKLGAITAYLQVVVPWHSSFAAKFEQYNCIVKVNIFDKL